MQLGEIGKAAVGVGKVFHFLLHVLVAHVLPTNKVLFQHLTHLHRRIGILQVIGSITIDVIQNLVSQLLGIGLFGSHDAQGLTSHAVLMTVHPRQQAAVSQAHPLIFSHLILAKGLHNVG